MIVELSFHYSSFSLHFLDLSFVLVIMFLHGCLVAHCLVVWYFHSPKFAVHFRKVAFVWDHLMYLALYYYFVYVFSDGFKVTKPAVLNYCTNLIHKPLACLKIHTFLPDINHSFPVSSLWRLARKIAVKCKLIVFPSSYFAYRSLMVVVSHLIFYIPEKKSSQHSQGDVRVSHVGYQESTCW